MSQKWNRTSPLHWLDAFLSWAITPFSRAKRIEDYATNGYRLMGIVLILVFLFLWVVGLLGVILSKLPASLRDIPNTAFGAIGRKVLPESIPLIVLVALLYWALYFIKRIRLFAGEKFANFFFGTMNIGIMAGEWCLEHRWTSLFIVMFLAGYITLGTFYFFDARGRNDQLKYKFDRWLDRVNYFCAHSTLKRAMRDKYRNEITPFWDGKFSSIIDLPGNHPAFTLHRMLEVLYTENHENNLEELESLVYSYNPADLQKMTPKEQQAWAWMNILLGRKYSQVCDSTKEYLYCGKANNIFGKVVKLDQPNDYKDYQGAAHNGRGTVYANVVGLLSQHPDAPANVICTDAVTCANNALDDYRAVIDSECSFIGVRSENNKIDLLARIGFYYKDLNNRDKINLSEICDNKSVSDGAALATCIEDRVKKLMKCTTTDEFIPTTYVTFAQAYGVIVTLRLASNPKADISREAEAAGNYLRLANILNTKDSLKGEDFNYFQNFLITKESKSASPNDKELPKNEEFQHIKMNKYQRIFWDALTSGFDQSFALDLEWVNNKIDTDLKKQK